MFPPLMPWIIATAGAVTPPTGVSFSLPEGQGIGVDGFAWYRSDEGVRIRTSAYEITIDRAGVQLVDLPLKFDHRFSLGYRRDRLPGEPDTVIGGVNGVFELVRPEPVPIIESVGMLLRSLAYDVDGNGLIDLATWDGLVLVHPDSAQLIGWPQPVLNDPEPWTVPWPIPDLDGDGRAELFESTVDGWEWNGLYIRTTEATVSIFPGTPYGYGPYPINTFRLPQWPGYVIPIQADNDTDWELFTVIADLSFDSPTGLDIRTAWIDDPLGDAIVHESTSVVGSTPLHNSSTLPPVATLPDLDGDGADEVLLLLRDFSEKGLSATHDIHLLGSTRGYELGDPLTQFSMLDAIDWRHDTSSGLEMLVVDLDDDGHLDLVAVQSTNPAAIHAWFGPLYEPPEPTHTGDTGHTTVSHTGKTTGPTGTADTAPPAPGPSPAIPTEPSGCACTSGPHPSAWRTLWRRRGGHSHMAACGVGPRDDEAKAEAHGVKQP